MLRVKSSRGDRIVIYLSDILEREKKIYYETKMEVTTSATDVLPEGKK